jgi:hypothetical protein
MTSKITHEEVEKCVEQIRHALVELWPAGLHLRELKRLVSEALQQLDEIHNKESRIDNLTNQIRAYQDDDEETNQAKRPADAPLQ